MTLRHAAALAVLLHAVPAPAQFEGVAHLKVLQVEEGHRMEGTGRLYLSPKAWRVEMEMAIPREGMPAGAKAGAGEHVQRFVAFGKAATPRKTWMLNEKTRTYAVVEGPEEEGGSAGEDAEGWTITRHGGDRIAGFACTNVKAVRAEEDEALEACFANEFLSGDWLKGLREADEEGWMVAARRAGVSGYPVRMVLRGKDGVEKSRFEVTKAERKRLPASLFEIPAGYRQGSVMETMGPLPGQEEQLREMQKQMEEAMKNLSPEQRKMMEDAMKQTGNKR